MKKRFLIDRIQWMNTTIHSWSTPTRFNQYICLHTHDDNAWRLRFLIKACTTFLGLCRISLINSSHKQPSYWTSIFSLFLTLFFPRWSVCNLHNHEKGHFACSREKMHCKAGNQFPVMNPEFQHFLRTIEEFIFLFFLHNRPRQFLFSCRQKRTGRTTIFTLIFPFIGFPWDVDWAFSPYIISHHESLNFS